MDDLKWRNLRTEIFKYAERHEMDSVEIMFAIADAVAYVAANLDLHCTPTVLNDRIDALVERIRERHPQIVTEIILHRAKRASG